VIIDAKTHEIVRCNSVAEDLIGLPEKEIVGKVCKKFICTASNGECPITDLGHTVDNSECILITSNGKEIPILKKAVPINFSGRDYIVESFVDISERKEMEKTLHELNEVLKLLNKNLRHDILNDLTAVGNYLELYSETRDKKLLNSAFKSIEKGVELIKRMRELESLITSGNNLKAIDVREILDDIVGNYQTKIRIKGEVTALADDALISVFDNIIRNAVVHGKASEIEVKMENKGNMCEIRIADNGSGIPDEIKDMIFEEGFSYGDNRGSGLGLYIVRKTVERYGGNISIEDNKPKGVTFVIKLKCPESVLVEA
jgi:PAS domain S-box-containing protein